MQQHDSPNRAKSRGDGTDEQERRRARLLVRATALAGGCLHSLPPLHAAGKIPLIIGLPDEMLASSLREVEKLGGLAYLIVLQELPGDGVRINVLRIEFGYGPATEEDDPLERPVHENLELGMLVRNIEVGEEIAYFSWGSESKVRFLRSIVLPGPCLGLT